MDAVICRIICLTIQTLCRSMRVFCTQLTNFLTKTIIMKTKFNKMMFAFVAAFALIVSSVSATVVNVQLTTGSWAAEVDFNLVDDATGATVLSGTGYGTYSNSTTYDHYVDLADPGCFTLNMLDSYGDGWNGGYITIIDSLTGAVAYTFNSFTSGATYTENFCLPLLFGCTDPGAGNYDPLATIEDGSCTYGCIASDTLESWETYGGGFGLTWANLPSNTVDWTVWSGGTSSGSTGPQNAYDGTYYVYTETSGAGSNSDARMQVQCVDLSAWTAPGLTFQYHMYGATMGTLDVNISTDGGLTWTNAWSLSGDQGEDRKSVV